MTLTDDGTVPVDEHLNVVGQHRIFALGDIADLTDPKMATWAQTQAPVVIENITSLLEGRAPTATYEPATQQRIFLPLGTRAGVGQLPTPTGGVTPAPTADSHRPQGRRPLHRPVRRPVPAAVIAVWIRMPRTGFAERRDPKTPQSTIADDLPMQGVERPRPDASNFWR